MILMVCDSIVRRCLPLLPLLYTTSMLHMLACVPGRCPITMPARLSRVSTPVASLHLLQPCSADGIIDCRYASCDSQLQWSTTTRCSHGYCWWSTFSRSARTSHSSRARGGVAGKPRLRLVLTLCRVRGRARRARPSVRSVRAWKPQTGMAMKLTLTPHPWFRWIQKMRPQKLKVRPRTATERAPTLTRRLLTPC